jgi:hypothetical protein
MHLNNFTSNVLPTILVGVFITENTPVTILESFVFSFFHHANYKKVNIRQYFVLGHQHYKHHFFSSHTYIIKMHENMNEGKTYFWFKKAVEIFKNQRIPYHPLNGIIKMDTDCAANWTYFNDQVISNLMVDYYFGRIVHYEECGQNEYCPPRFCHNFKQKKCWIYMQGGFYGMSLSVAQHLMRCEFAIKNKLGPEDVQVGFWIAHCYKSNIKLKNIKQGSLFCHSKKITPQHIKTMEFQDVCSQSENIF